MRYQLGTASIRRYEKSTKLWRYLTFDKFAWLLDTGKLWHARLDQLGDPFEGSFPKGHVQKRDAGQLLETRQPLSPENDKWNNKAVPYSHFATCWYASPHETEAMWKLYSNQNAGVAIVSTPLRMHESVNLYPYGQGILSPIEYKDFETDDMILRPVSVGFGRHAHPALLKRRSFEHENEVRGLIHMIDYSKVPNPCASNELADFIRNGNPKGIAVNVDLKGLIEEIYISPLASCYFQDVVRFAAERHRLADRIHLSTLLGEPVC